MQQCLLVSGIGIVLSVVGLFLPWVKASFAGMALPLLEGLIGTVYPDIAAIVRQFSAYTSISGFDALFGADLVDGGFRVIVALPILYAILAVPGLLILQKSGGQARWLSAALALLGLGVIAVLVVNITNLSRLGYGDNWILAAGIALLGFAPDIGFWLSLVGAAAIAGGMLLCYLGAAQAQEQRNSLEPWA